MSSAAVVMMLATAVATMALAVAITLLAAVMTASVATVDRTTAMRHLLAVITLAVCQRTAIFHSDLGDEVFLCSLK